MTMISLSKKEEKQTGSLRLKMNKKATIGPWIRYYQDLLMRGKIQPQGGAHKRLIELQKRYASLM